MRSLFRDSNAICCLQNRRSAGDVVRGDPQLRDVFLTYGRGGVLQAKVENTIALEQPTKPAWSNSTESLNGGWPSYEFGDGSNGYLGNPATTERRRRA